MKTTLIAFFILLGAATVQAATYNNIGGGSKGSSNSAEKQINNKIQQSDKINEINGNLNKYNGSTKPSDVYDYNRYQMDKSKETFKK